MKFETEISVFALSHLVLAQRAPLAATRILLALIFPRRAQGTQRLKVLCLTVLAHCACRADLFIFSQQYVGSRLCGESSSSWYTRRTLTPLVTCVWQNRAHMKRARCDKTAITEQYTVSFQGAL